MPTTVQSSAAPAPAFRPPAVPIGSLLDGRFQIREFVNRSRVAEVYRATDLRDERDVAIKVPLLQVESDPVGFGRFRTEAEAGRQFDHPNLLAHHAVEGKQSRPYVVMEYLRGRTLSHVMHAMRPMPEFEAMKIATQVCAGLEHMHARGFVHRDLKPGNIMIGEDGRSRIFDFGIATPPQRSRSVLAKLGAAFGTPEYMAPEQVENEPVDERADVYSLGAILYEMLTGQVPFRRDDPWESAFARISGDPIAPRKLNPEISRAAEEIVLHALQRRPEDRYPSAAAFRAELEAPEQVVITGYCDRLRAPRWKLSLQATPIAAGILIGMGVIAALTGMFLALRYALPPR